MESLYEHNKTGKTYALLGHIENKTDDSIMALYKSVDTNKQYVRTKEDFHESFTSLKVFGM